MRGEAAQVITKSSKTNNKYMQNYGQNKDPSFLQYVDLNSLYAWAMCRKLPTKNFEWSKGLRYINQKFIKNYDEDSSEKGYIIEVDAECPRKLQDEHSDLPFLPEKIKINKQTKLTCNFYDKARYVVHIKLLQQALNHGLKFKKVHRSKCMDERIYHAEH